MKILLFFLFSFFIKIGFCQNSEVIRYDPNRAYNQKFIDSLIDNPEIYLSLSGYKKMLESDETLYGWPHYYYGMSRIVLSERKYDSVIHFANLGIKSYETAELKRRIDEKTLIVIYFLKAKALKERKDSYNAIKALQVGLDLTKKHPYKWESYIGYDIANNFKSLGNNDLALKYHLINTKDTIFMSREACSTYNSIGYLYELTNKPDSSKFYYLKALKIGLDSDQRAELQTSLLNLGSLYKNQKMKDSAIYYYKRARLELDKVYDDVGYEDQLKYTTLIHGYFGDIEDNSQKVISELPQLIHEFLDIVGDRFTKKELDAVLSGYDYLSSAYLNKGLYQEVINISKKEKELLLKHNHQIQDEKIEQLEIQYQTKEKDASIAQLEQNKLIQETIIEQRETIMYALLGLLILLTLLGVLFWRQRKLKNQYEKENLEQRLLRSQMNPHFIGNAMNTVSALVESKSENTISYINKLSNLFRLILTNSREEFVSLEDELITIKNYLELQSNFAKNFDFKISIDQNIDQEELIIPPMLIQPFIENAIIHGLSSKESRGFINVEVIRQDEDGLLLFKINDNGIGYSKSINININKNHKSISGQIIKERLSILRKKFKVNARFKVYTQTDHGTCVELYLPYLID